jgi:hypothetical protein
MSGKLTFSRVSSASLVQVGLSCLLVLLVLTNASAQQNVNTTQVAAKQVAITKSEPAAPKPVFQGYKKVMIGMTFDEVKNALGKAQSESAEELFYTFDEETAQILFDRDKKVRVISLNYTEKAKNVPKFEDVFGADVAKEPAADGRLYKMVRYPEAGFWVAYDGSVNGNAAVSVTIQKI